MRGACPSALLRTTHIQRPSDSGPRQMQVGSPDLAVDSSTHTRRGPSAPAHADKAPSDAAEGWEDRRATAVAAHGRAAATVRPYCSSTAVRGRTRPGTAWPVAGGRRAHGGPPRPTRLRRVPETSDRPGAPSVLQARRGRRLPRSDAWPGPRTIRRRRPRPGAYVATRLALDRPEAVSALNVLDTVPIDEALRRCDAKFAASRWHWFFLAQTGKPAERIISADPDAWYGGTPEQMGAEAYEDPRRAIHDPAGGPVTASSARCGSCGPPVTTWPTSTATSPRRLPRNSSPRSAISGGLRKSRSEPVRAQGVRQGARPLAQEIR